MKLADKWRASAAEWNPLSPVAGAYLECARDLEQSGIEARLAHLESWLESRGLPKDYRHLDHWRWIIDGFVDGRRAKVAHTVVCATDDDALAAAKDAGVRAVRVIPWNQATSEQKAEALRIEAERSAK